MKIKSVCVLGGTGFVGQHLVARLIALGFQVKVLSRHPERHRDLLVLPGIRLVQANIHDQDELIRHFAGMDAVINLVGILHNNRKSGRGFHDAHVALVKNVVEACHNNGVKRLLHMSALNADQASGTSHYLRSKGEGENLAHTLGKGTIEVTSFRPSIIFGRGDHFFNQFALLIRIAPGFLPLAAAWVRFAPVYAEELVSLMAHSLKDKQHFGKHIDVCGPKTYTLLELVKLTAERIGSRKIIIPLSRGLSQLMASILQFMPGKPLTPDNLDSMKRDNVCSGKPDTIITTTTVEAGMTIGSRDLRSRYYDYRIHARRQEN